MNATPVSKFGKDHWSMLAYLETLCVDGREGIGTIDKRRVRCNENTHPLCKGIYSGESAWKPNYSTRLFGFFEFPDRGDTQKAVEAGLQLLGHDDWDCADDLEAACFVEVINIANGFVRMTKEGSRVCGLLREHKSTGGMFANFSLNHMTVAA